MKSIIFSADMVQAILAGHKTQTRRVVSPQIKFFQGECFDVIQHYVNGKVKRFLTIASFIREKAPHKIGDILYVKETYCPSQTQESNYHYWTDGETIKIPSLSGGVDEIGRADGLKWRPSIHMPREAARLFLRVTDVRVERLQDISLHDICCEGILPNFLCKNEFINLWNGLNAKRDGGIYAWERNPWVWVYTFERCEKPGGSDDNG